MESSPPPPHRRLRGIGLTLATIVVALGGFVLVLLFFEGRDDSQVPGAAGGGNAPGRVVSDQRRASAPAPPIRRDAVRLSEDQLLHALELGDVVLVYGTGKPPPQLHALQEQVSGPFDPVLAANGAAVILASRPGTDGVVALAWRRILRTPTPSDPELERFAEYWLGRGGG